MSSTTAIDRLARGGLLAELLRPETYGAGGADVVLHETHISWVFLTADRAYKIKKPVTLPFLDYGTLDLRRVACEREVVLNRRLAPDLYLGVRALVAVPSGRLALAPSDAPEAVEYAVEMRRFREEDTLAGRIGSGDIAAADLERIGAWLAEFHDRAAVRAGSAEAVKRTLDDTFASLLAAGRPVPSLERFAASFLAARRTSLDDRASRGLVRDGHGDLRAEHLLLTGEGVAAVDCLEFSDSLRTVDVGEDLAFLVMDLVRLDRDDLVEPLLRGYRTDGGDPGDEALVAFHAMARALVRAKVAILRCHQLTPGTEAASASAAEADALLSIATRLGWQARRPVLVAVAGVAASGKSTLARALADASGLAHFESDRVRKQLAGLDPHQRGTPQLYDRIHDDATYTELIARAVAVAAVNGGAIVAATFRCHLHRAALVEASRVAGLRLLVVECLAPAAVLRERAVHRASAGTDVSDAGLAVVEAHLRDREPFDDVPSASHLPVRTDRPIRQLVRAVEDALDQPEGERDPQPTGDSNVLTS